MQIKLHEVTIRDLCKGYEDNGEEGVVGLGGKLNIRPKYQREFVYNPKRRNAVMYSVMHGFPINTMYWVDHGDGTFEVLDGQQRIISICQYVNHDYSINEKYIHNLTKDQQEQILNYRLMVYFCKGTDSEKLAWFKIVNIAGVKLTKQELRNAVYAGPWLSDAKTKFSKVHGPAQELGGKYMKGHANRQDYLEATLDWISNGHIKHYMAEHQFDPNANKLWQYYMAVIEWVKTTFPHYRRIMNKGVDWGSLYNVYKDKTFDTDKLEDEIKKLLLDDDVTKNKGVYDYVLTGDERALNIRAFTPKMKREAYERQGGKCAKCGKHFPMSKMQADHIVPWSKGGSTSAKNCQLLCQHDNAVKSNKY